MRNVSDKTSQKTNSTHLMFNTFVVENRAGHDLINVREYDRSCATSLEIVWSCLAREW